MAPDPRISDARAGTTPGDMPQESVEAGLLPPGRWLLDPERSTLGFRVKKMGLYHVKGSFRSGQGSVEVGDGGRLTAEARIDADSIYTRIPPRDAHLRSAQFLDVKRHPDVRFRADAVRPAGDGAFGVTGVLEVRGESVPVELRAHTHGASPGAGPVHLHLEGTVDRHRFGIRPPQPFEMVVGGDVHLDLLLHLERAS